MQEVIGGRQGSRSYHLSTAIEEGEKKLSMGLHLKNTQLFF